MTSSCLKVEVDEIPDLNSFTREELVCAICSNLVCCPLNLSVCPHAFCKNCLQRWFELKQHASCPLCRVVFPEKSFDEFSINRFLQNKVEQLKMRCPNAIHGCTKLISLKDHGIEKETHFVMECEYVQETCPHCFFAVLRKDEQKHLSVCSQYFITCEDCKVKLTPLEMKSHRAQPNECSGFVPCPNHCDQKYIHQDQVNHHMSVCSSRKIECPICNECFSASDTTKHFQDNIEEPKHQDHLLSLWKSVIQQCVWDQKSGIGKCLQKNDCVFIQDKKDSKWIPVQIIQESMQHVVVAQEVQSKENKPRKISFVPSKEAKRILSFDDGVNTFWSSNSSSFSIGSRVRVRSNDSKVGMVTLIENQQVQLNAKDWYHVSEIQLAPLTGPSSNQKRKTLLDSEKFWNAFNSSTNIREIEHSKRQRVEENNENRLLLSPYYEFDVDTNNFVI